MSDLISEIKGLVKGEVDDSAEAREFYSHDASLFEMLPEVVVAPIDSGDIKRVVKFVGENKKTRPELSITARSAGTDMSGGAINDSIVLDFTKHFNRIIETSSVHANVQPGVYYRDFEVETLKHGSLMPSFPASRDLCTVGGMVANNSGGEMSLRYGKTIKFVTKLSAVLADGQEYTFKPLNKPDLDKKMAQKDYEGNLYRKVFDLVDTHYEAIKAARPHVSKNSTGYNIWDLWDRRVLWG
jgi:FAD/FMN-containing dehydrogenase